MNLTTVQGRIYRRLGENPASPQWWTLAESAAAINWAQRLFALLTLCLEQQQEWTLTPGVRFYHLAADPDFPDWLLPLRVRLANDPSKGASSAPVLLEPGAPMPSQTTIVPATYSTSPRLKPARLADFDAYSDTWPTDIGTPDHYALLGADLFVVDRATPLGSAIKLDITYAAVPPMLVAPTDNLVVPASDQYAVADLATIILRLKDGGQELAKTKPLMSNFVETAKRRAGQVRARSMAAQYDRVPFELERWDWSRLFSRRKDLPPAKTEDAWPISASK
jgi:hypothetical protein